MQSSRMFGRVANAQTASFMVRQRAVPMLKFQQPAVRNLRMQATPKMRMPVPKEEHSAHTISQRLRTLKRIPPELIPLGVVLAAAIIAAVYSMGRKFYTDKTLRLYRQGKQGDH